MTRPRIEVQPAREHPVDDEMPDESTATPWTDLEDIETLRSQD